MVWLKTNKNFLMSNPFILDVYGFNLKIATSVLDKGKS
jgi:hypothetical protein